MRVDDAPDGLRSDLAGRGSEHEPDGVCSEAHRQERVGFGRDAADFDHHASNPSIAVAGSDDFMRRSPTRKASNPAFIATL